MTVVVAGRLVVGDAAAAHVERALVHAHAAAPGVAAVAGRLVAGDDGCAAHVELAAVHKHAAAMGSVVDGDAAALHVERAAAHAHAAAVDRRIVVVDAAAVHIERAIFHIYAAAVGACPVAGDTAAVHVERAVAHIHAASLTVFTASRLVAGDAAAVQIERAAAAHIHATAHLRRVAGNTAAVHIERTAVHMYAQAFLGAVGDFAAPTAVGQRHNTARLNSIIARVDGDGFAIQIQCHAVNFGKAPSVRQRHIRRQVVVARIIGQCGCIAPRLPCYVGVLWLALAIHVVAYLAADRVHHLRFTRTELHHAPN